MSEPRTAISSDGVGPLRPEIVRDQMVQFAVVQKPLSAIERIYNQVWLRKLLILVVLALICKLMGVT
jgi:NitT/TauT family transport system permease protein